MSLYRRPNSPFWWSKIYAGGSVVRFSTGERTKVAALRKERERAAALERLAKIEGRFSLATLAAKFIGWKQARGRSEDTIEALQEHIDTYILPFFGGETDVRVIDRAAMEEFMTARLSAKKRNGDPVLPQTVSKEMSTLRGMLRYACDVHRIIDSVPTVRSPTVVYEPKWTILTQAQLEQLLDELGKRKSKEVLPFFLLLANTGMRTGETKKLTWEMVDFDRLKLNLPKPIRKTKRPLVLDINEAAYLALRMVWKEGAIGRVFSQRDFRAALSVSCKTIGIEPIRPHDFRHTYASLLHEKGVAWHVARDLLGHITMSMMNHYAHAFDEARKKAAAAVVVLPSSTSRATH